MNRLTYAAMILLTGAPAQAQELNPSPYETRDESIAPVDAVVVEGAFRVSILTTADAPHVSFHGPAALVADAQATISDGTLTISFKDNEPWSWNPGSGVNVVVSLPSIASVRTAGPAQIMVFGAKVEDFAAATDGAGQIEVERLDAGTVTAAIGGSGAIRLEGIARKASYAIGGAGSIEGKRLRVAHAHIAIGGAGSVYADVSDTAQIAVSGAGRVDLVGGADCTVQPPDARNVECR